MALHQADGRPPVTSIYPGDDVQIYGMAVSHRVLAIATVRTEDGIERQTFIITPLSNRGVAARAVRRRVEAQALLGNLTDRRPRRPSASARSRTRARSNR